MVYITFEHRQKELVPSKQVRREGGGVLIGEGVVDCSIKQLHLKLILDVGCLSENREKFISQLRNPYVDKEKAVAINYDDKINELLEYINKGEDFVVEMYPTAESLCGLYYLCSLCRQNRIQVVYNDNSYDLNEETIQTYAYKWSKLVEENGVLRIIDKGELKSVEEDYYDNQLFSLLSDKIVYVRLFNSLLYQHNLPVLWVNYRIREFIEKGVIEVVEDHHIILERYIKVK